jgi:IS30 family transposase
MPSGGGIHPISSQRKSTLIAKLRRKHPHRLKHGRVANAKKARIADVVSIHERPDEIEGCQIMGHWQVDLIIGKHHKPAVGTLVERKSRFVYLTQLNKQTAQETRLSFTQKLKHVPPEIRLSLTYDQGTEMSLHKTLTSELDMSVYFCDPYAAWQKGTLENTNGLVREFLPRGTDLSDLTQGELDAISYSLNTRPRKALGFMTP